MKRVLVTGADGFVGRHCLPKLAAAGFDVHAASNRRYDDRRDATWHEADLLEPRRAAQLVDEIRPTHLLHLAWCTEPGKYWTSLDNARWLAASVELLLAFVESGGRRFVHAGTCAEYDWTGDGVCVEGKTPLRPSTLYGRCKHALFEAARGLAQQTKTSFACGRLFFLYGPGEQPERLVPAVIRGLLRGERVATSSGEQRRDFMYVEDAAAAFAALVDRDVEGEVNIATGEALEVRKVIGMIVERLGARDLVALGARPTSATEPPLLVADVTRLRDDVGFVPQVSLDEGLARSIAFWKERA